MCLIHLFFSLWGIISKNQYMSCLQQEGTVRSCTDTSTGLIFTLLSSKFITSGNLCFWPEAKSIVNNTTGPQILQIIRRLRRNPDIECDDVISDPIPVQQWPLVCSCISI